MSIQLKVGQVVTFKGYSEPLEEGEEPTFEEGDQLKLVKKIDDEQWQAASVSDPKKKDSVFVEEIEVGESTETPAKQKGKKSETPKIGKGKAPAPKEAPPKEKVKKGKVKAPPAEEELEILPPESYSESVRKVTKSDASALKTAKALTEKIAENFWTLGGVLSYIYRHKSYKTLTNEAGEAIYSGKQGFANYVMTELGMEYRKAMYYIDIHEKFAPLGVDESRLIQIGWSKVAKLTNVVNAKNVEKWLAKAEELGREDLEAEIKTQRVKAGSSGSVTPSEQTAERTRFKFALFEDQGKVAIEALEQAAAATGSDDPNVNFHHIVSEWLALNSGDAASIPIDEAFRVLENRYSLAEVAKYAKRYK